MLLAALVTTTYGLLIYIHLWSISYFCVCLLNKDFALVGFFLQKFSCFRIVRGSETIAVSQDLWFKMANIKWKVYCDLVRWENNQLLSQIGFHVLFIDFPFPLLPLKISKHCTSSIWFLLTFFSVVVCCLSECLVDQLQVYFGSLMYESLLCGVILSCLWFFLFFS